MPFVCFYKFYKKWVNNFWSCWHTTARENNSTEAQQPVEHQHENQPSSSRVLSTPTCAAYCLNVSTLLQPTKIESFSLSSSSEWSAIDSGIIEGRVCIKCIVLILRYMEHVISRKYQSNKIQTYCVIHNRVSRCNTRFIFCLMIGLGLVVGF